MKRKTIIDLFESSVNRYASNTFLMQKEQGEYRSTTYRQTQDCVYQLGAGLVSLGVKPKDNLALLSEGRNYWIISELAIFYAGATNVPLSIKLEESNDLLFLHLINIKCVIPDGFYSSVHISFKGRFQPVDSISNCILTS